MGGFDRPIDYIIVAVLERSSKSKSLLLQIYEEAETSSIYRDIKRTILKVLADTPLVIFYVQSKEFIGENGEKVDIRGKSLFIIPDTEYKEKLINAINQENSEKANYLDIFNSYATIGQLKAKTKYYQNIYGVRVRIFISFDDREFPYDAYILDNHVEYTKIDGTTEDISTLDSDDKIIKIESYSQ